MLESVTIFYFFPDCIYDVGPVQMLANYHFHSIHYWMKEMRMAEM